MLWLVGIDLRITVLAVPPVIPLIHRDLPLDEKAIGALTGMPTLLWGAAAVGGALLIARIGARRATIVGLLLVALAGAARGFGPSVPVLFGMTFVMAAGIAISQPAAPTLVGEWFPRSIGFATAVYVNGLLVGEALAAALTIPAVLPLLGGSWPLSFAWWSLPVVLTALAFVALTSHDPAPLARKAAWFPDWRDPLTWQLGLMQGGVSVIYFAANAYIPDYFHANGRPELIGPALAALNVGQIPSSVLTLFVAQRLAGRRDAFVAIGVVAMIGMTAIVLAPPALVVASAAILGFCTALSLVVIVALPAMLTERHEVHRLAAGAYTIGYPLAFFGTVLGGVVWDATRIPAAAFVPVWGGALLVMGLGATLRGRPGQAGPAGAPPEGTVEG